VEEAKNRIDPEVAQTNRDAAACAALTADEKTAWAAFYAAWRRFYCRNDTGTCATPDVSIWGLGSQMDEAESYERTLADWQGRIASKCALSGPEVTPPAPPPDPMTWARYGAFALGAVGAIVLLVELGPVLRALAPAPRRSSR
jgi:hypothetical protein